MIIRVDPVKRMRNENVKAATGQLVSVTYIEYILIVYAYGSDKKGYVHTRVIGDAAHGFPSMVNDAYMTIENELSFHLSSRNISIIVRHCTCGHRRGRQDGYTQLNRFNDWGCGKCRKPTIHFLRNVIIPREMHNIIY